MSGAAYRVAKVGRVTETERRMVVDRGWQVGNEEVLFPSCGFSENDEKVLETDSGYGCTTL